MKCLNCKKTQINYEGVCKECVNKALKRDSVKKSSELKTERRKLKTKNG